MLKIKLNSSIQFKSNVTIKMNSMKYIAMLIFLCCSLNAWSQSSPNDYVFTTNMNATLYNMNGADTLIRGGQDNIMDDARQLPFIFGFLGGLHAAFSVKTNGVVYLSPEGGNSNFFQIAAFRADGNGSNYQWSGSGMGTSKNGAIVCKSFGSEPARQFVISFEKMSLSQQTGNDDATFQVVLHEGSGTVQFIYGVVNVSDTVNNIYNPMISKTSFNQHLSVNTTSHTATYSTGFPWGYTVNPGTIPGLHSPVNGSCRTYVFTPPSIPNYIDTQLVFSNTISGITQMTIPELNPAYSYFYRTSRSATGPFGVPSALSTNVLQGIPDSTLHYRLYRSNGAAVSSNYASGFVTYGAGRKFISQINGIWSSPATWGIPPVTMPMWGDTVIISQGDTVKLDNFSAPAVRELIVEGVLDYGNVLNNPVAVMNLHITATGRVIVHDGSTAFNSNSINGGTLIVMGNITGQGKLDMRYNNCKLQLKTAATIAPQLIDVNFEHGNNNTPLLNSLVLSTYNDVQLLTPLTINKEVIGEYGTLLTNNNLSFDKNAATGGQPPPADFSIYRYSRNPLFTGNVNYANGTLPCLYYMNKFLYYSLSDPFPVPQFVAGNEVPANNSVQRLYVRSNAGVDVTKAITVAETIELVNGHVNMVNGNDFTFSGTNFNYDGGGIRTAGWVKLYNAVTTATGVMNTPGNSNVYPIISNGAKRFAFLQGALAASGLYGVKHTNMAGVTALAASFAENGNSFGKRSNSYWEVSSPSGIEFADNAFHFRASGIDSIINPHLTAVCFANGAAAGTHLATSGGKETPFVSRTGLNSSSISSNNFYIAIADANPLSQDLLSFSGRRKGESNLLEWMIALPRALKSMELQKSTDGKFFEKIVDFPPNDNQSKYSYLDTRPFDGNNFYRLKLTDGNMSQSYSNVVLITVQATQQNIYCFPNPARQMINISLENTQIKSYTIYNILGEKQVSGTLNTSNGMADININNLQNGTYLLHLYNEQGLIYSTKFLKL